MTVTTNQQNDNDKQNTNGSHRSDGWNDRRSNHHASHSYKEWGVRIVQHKDKGKDMKKPKMKEEEDKPHGYNPKLGEYLVMIPDGNGLRVIAQSHSDIGACSKAFKSEEEIYYITQMILRVGMVEDEFTDDEVQLLMMEELQA